MNLREYLKENIVFLDGGMGTLLQKKGLLAGELPERWNITHSEIITEIHKAYFDAGSNIVNTNTFGANLLKFSKNELEEIIAAAVNNAKNAAKISKKSGEKWVALDIGPTGKMLKPLGDLEFEKAVEIFAETVKLGVKYGADLIVIETMNDSYETKAALLAAKENSSLPVFVTNAFGEDEKLLTGADASACVAMLEGLGADAIGINCSYGPKKLMPIAEDYLALSSLPVILKANAGLPQVVNGETVFDVSAEDFAEQTAKAVESGVRIVGGCCGTTPEYIEKLVGRLNNIKPKEITKKDITAVSSYTHAVVFGNAPVIIGERINPTGKKRFKEALKENDIDYILKEGIAQQEKGAHTLDVNVGLPEIDEEKMLVSVIKELQAVCDLPLQIDTSNCAAMEKALRIYNGKPLINSVNGKKESMEAVFPLAKKYGGVVIALTLDENGIPERAEERVKIAQNILKNAEKYGIDKKDIIFDPLTLTVSTGSKNAAETMKSVELLTKMGLKTSLGVSNVSFGLPRRDLLNSAFFLACLQKGLCAAIINPYSDEMMGAYKAYCLLEGFDETAEGYIAFCENTQAALPVKTAEIDLKTAVIKGLREPAAALCKEALETKEAMEIIETDIIPALDLVGEGYEQKKVYLPSLLMSAEAAGAAFEEIKKKVGSAKPADKCEFVLATVKGDIHDIGKNIVKLLLENYGFRVIDLGRDTPPEAVLEAVEKHHAKLAGLSALMTTTVPAMEETVKLLKEKAPYCKVVVGGAVLTKEYAEKIGADKYSADAMETVRYAEEISKI
ncbi:MAG: homocysteine S-methyltransferase family protein [Clostridiales bacterium]|nr:homocysteine S-methyltransferase family protein [Candidatus Equinaster intestinalis]